MTAVQDWGITAPANRVVNSETGEIVPQRIQLRRTKGWRLPLHAKSVARPTKWGNPFVVWRNGEWYADTYDAGRKCMGWAIKCADNLTARTFAANAYRAAIDNGSRMVPSKDEIRGALAGLDLACWCPLPGPGEVDQCHARVLLDICTGGENG